MRLAQFRPHAVGVKTARMLEVESRLGRTLEADFREFYVEKGWGQKKLAKRWGVTRPAIFGRGETTVKCWVQVLGLPVRREARAVSPKPAWPSPACEICGAKGVLEGAHWIPAAKGGEATPSNVLKLCPNCHKQLDLRRASLAASSSRGQARTGISDVGLRHPPEGATLDRWIMISSSA